MFDQIADYIRTSPRVAKEFGGPPGYKKIPAEIATIRAGPNAGNRPLKTPDGRLVDQKTATVEEFIDACSVFAGTPDQVYDQIARFYDLTGGFGHLLMMGQGHVLLMMDLLLHRCMMGNGSLQILGIPLI